MADLRTHRRRYLVLLLALCPVAAIVLLPRPPDFSVGRKAVRVTTATNWVRTELGGNLSYQWQSTNGVLASLDGGRIALVDTRTGVEQPLTPLMNAFRRRPELARLANGMPAGWIVSPDRQWLLTYLVAQNCEWVAARVDGSQIVETPTTPGPSPDACWEPDSRGFHQFAIDHGRFCVRHFSLFGPNPPASTPIGRAPHDLRLYLPAFRFENPYLPLGEYGKDQLMVANFGAHRDERFLEYNLRSTALPERVNINLPPGAAVEEIEISPDGQRIGWIFDFSFLSGDPRLRRLPFMPVPPGHGNHEVWVSNRDGSSMHPVATQGLEFNPVGPTNLRWTPDSKNVTFLYCGALYKAPAG